MTYNTEDYRHIFAPRADFDARTAAALEGRPKARRSLKIGRPGLMGLGLVAAALYTVKLAAVVSLGTTAYEAKVASFDAPRVVVAALEVDPVARAATKAELRLKDVLRRAQIAL